MGNLVSAPYIPPEFSGLQIQTAVNTVCIPIIWGTPRASINLIYMNDFTAQPTTQQAAAKGQVAGGKSGPGGVTSYTYYATLILGIGEGPLGTIICVFQDQGIYNLDGLAGGVQPDYFEGATNQQPWPYLVDAHPNDARPYNETAYLAANNWLLDATATVPQFNMLVQGHYQGTAPTWRADFVIANPNAPASPAEQTVEINLDMDADPALVIVDFLTNAQYGVYGFPADLIDYTTVYSTANSTNPSIGDNTLQTYCQAVGLAFSIYLNAPESAASILDRWMKILNVAMVWTGTSLKFIPYYDAQISGTGYDSGNEAGIPQRYYVPNLTVIVSLTDDDFVKPSEGDDPLTIERIDTADVYNTVRLTFKDRTNLWNDNVAEAKNESDINLNGTRIANISVANEFSDARYAQMSAGLIVARNTSIRRRFLWKLSWEYCYLDPMDIVQVTDVNLGLSNYPVRIISIEEDDKFELSIIAEDFPEGSQAPPLYPNQPMTSPQITTNFPAESVNEPFIMEPNVSLLVARPVWHVQPYIVIGLCGGPNGAFDPNWTGADIYVSTDGVSYGLVGRFQGRSTMGLTTAHINAYGGTNPDTTNTLSVDLSQSDGSLDSFTDAQASIGVSLCAVIQGSNIEYIAFRTATLTGPNKYNLTHLYRGMFGSTSAAFSTGAQFLFMGDEQYFKQVLPDQYVGVQLYFKFTSFNKFAGTTQLQSDVPAYLYTPVGSGIGPTTIWQIQPNITTNTNITLSSFLVPTIIVLAPSASGSFNVTMPPSPYNGEQFQIIFEQMTSGTVTILPNAGQTLSQSPLTLTGTVTTHTLIWRNASSQWLVTA